ncbi:hypothetical protein BH18THE2_BH18THE2_13840 [soil metagenome]
MNLDKSINNLSQRLNKLYSENSNNINYNDGINYWKGRKIIPINQWLQTKKDYMLKAALQFFPDNHPHYGLRYILDNIGDPKLKDDADRWYSEYEDLMEHRRNPIYGRKKCSRCLISPDREQARIFLGINKIIANALERLQNVSSLSPSVYPCPILNIFECPYATKKHDNEVCGKETETTTILDVNDLFELSEIAFQLELALAVAQVMTKSNDTKYETNFETGKVRETGYYGNQLSVSIDDQLEEKIAEVKRLSKVPIRNADDIYHVLTDMEMLDKVLDQGLDEEHQKYKDNIVNFFMSIKDSIRKEDLFNAQNPDSFHSDNNRRQYAKCLICQGFANIHCISCNDVWLCVDHWRRHRGDKHNSKR